MATGIKSLRKIQLGRESAAGTAVAATTIWRGMGSIQNDLVTTFPEEDIGYISGTDRSYVPFKGASISMDSVEATFEQIQHIFEAGIRLVTTGSADGSGSGKIYNYVMPTTQGCDMSSSTRPIKTYTIEGGDNNEVEEMEYSFVESFTISGSAMNALMVNAEWKGRQVSNSSFTTAATLPSVEEIIFSKGSVYIDAVGGTIGSTQVSNTILEASVDVNTGLKGIATADGNNYFSFVKGTMPEVTMSITFEHNASATAEKSAWEAGTARQIRLKFLGSAFTTAGSAHTYKTLIIDLAGKWEKFDAISDSDGNDIVVGTFRARYNSTADLFSEFLVVNTNTTVP